jgi:predicted nucleic acid-binding protein
VPIATPSGCQDTTLADTKIDIPKQEETGYNVAMGKKVKRVIKRLYTVKRVYVESSVVSGMFDKNDHPERAKPFWDAVKAGKIRVVISDVVVGEVNDAPPHVRDFFDTIPKSQIDWIVSTEESNRLARVYTAARIITKKHLTDCKHVALAALAHADAIVSFNCTHIVNENRIDRYNDFNVAFGLPRIAILTPDEVQT